MFYFFILEIAILISTFTFDRYFVLITTNADILISHRNGVAKNIKFVKALLANFGYCSFKCVQNFINDGDTKKVFIVKSDVTSIHFSCLVDDEFVCRSSLKETSIEFWY